METILVKAAQLILSLSILVVLHELGHFMFARLFKTRVEKFYLFFDPWFSLFKVKKGETEYGVGWLPLGGYVKISGMIDESMDKEAMKQPPKPWEFRSKPAWQRLLIMLGGVMMNFIFAMIIYIGVLFAWGEQYLPTENVTYGIVASEAGEEIGLQTGDKILSVDNRYIENFSKIIPTVVLDDAKSIQVERNGQVVDIPITQSDLSRLLKSKSVMTPRIPFRMRVEGFTPESPGQEAGIQVGDEIKMLNGKTFEYYDQWSKELQNHKGEPVTLTVERNGEPVEINMTLGEEGVIGIRMNQFTEDYFQLETISYGFFE